MKITGYDLDGTETFCQEATNDMNERAYLSSPVQDLVEACRDNYPTTRRVTIEVEI